MTKFSTAILAIGLAALCSSLATASDFDGSRALLCVPTDAFACDGLDACERVTVEELNIPQFVNIDFKKKKMGGVLASGEESTTAIQQVKKAEGRTILQGAENGRGWSMVLDQATGNMSAAVAGEDAGFLLFGACTVR